MRKKLILALVTFAMAVGAYLFLSRVDYHEPPPAPETSSDALHNLLSGPATQPSQPITEAGMSFRSGDATLARVYDDITGRLKYQFEAKTWEPISETDFRLRNLLIQIFAPRGEITYVHADEAEITLARKAKNRMEPKRGSLKGQVKVVIDRTTAEWREANPDRAGRSAHPDELIEIDLEEARFDLDQAELHSEGPITVDSREARIDNVRGLTLQWSQLDNRIDALAFKHGGRMLLRRGGKIVDFGMPGGEREGKTAAEPPADAASSGVENQRAAARFQPPRARANKPMSVEAVTADEAAAQVRAEGGFAVANQPKSLDNAPVLAAPTAPPASPRQSNEPRSPEALAADVEALRTEARAATTAPTVAAGLALALDADAKAKKKVQSYSAIFQNRVVVQQKDGEQTIGKLEADRLELNFDFGRKMKDLTRSPSQRTRPPGEAASRPASQPAGAAPDDALPLEEDATMLVLTWDGPLDLKPLRADPAEQTGQRFDAIATGRPVVVESKQGTARCRQLVYRHERSQVWLSGTEQEPADMGVGETRKLVGREVFFDQKRGLARVDGAGYMLDERRAKPEAGQTDLLNRTANLLAPSGKEGSRPEDRRVEIRWSRGVDIELSTRLVKRVSPKTGLKEDKRKEFLQRAWFHGQVSVKQGDSLLAAEEVAATFGLPLADEEVADHIQHLNVSGNVKLSREDDLISAERLDVELTVTPEGKNIPRVVDGEGEVLVRQGKAEFRADRVHAVLRPLSRRPDRAKKNAPDGTPSMLGGSRLGIEALEAVGRVFVSDPGHNLNIRKAQTLTCTMHEDNRLAQATIVGAKPSVPARLRYGEMAIHGQRIEIDMDAQAVDVPGPGQAWMVSHKDFSGRALRTPAPVKTTWDQRMEFRLAKDYGVFVGNVRSETRTFTLSCDKLTVRFGRLPPVREQKADRFIDRFWILGAITSDQAEVKTIAPATPDEQRSRPVAVVAEGHAEALSSNHTPGPSAGNPGRLLNRLRIAGDQIMADLLREQMSVPGAGSLLIEDYQFEPGGARGKLAAGGLSGDPLMSSMREEGPSQTLVTWENSMDFFVDRNLVAFDKNVLMIHRSGQEVVLKDELASAMRIDIEALRRMRVGRKASLSCGYLLLEFLAAAKPKDNGDAAPVVRATDLQRLIAKHAVHLQEGTKSLMGAHLQYLHDVDEVRLEGGAALEARIIDQDEANQRFNMWRGPLLIWNRQTNRVEAPGATIRASR
jgi:lipopolysaccharide export system protein LptA